jgi:hypothetical protein
MRWWRRCSKKRLICVRSLQQPEAGHTQDVRLSQAHKRLVLHHENDSGPLEKLETAMPLPVTCSDRQGASQ